nr:MAG TPA: hypothetical protein [Caudoviricetes sp.]
MKCGKYFLSTLSREPQSRHTVSGSAASKIFLQHGH